ncbi:MAG: hypothetical protein MJE77_39210 [Proteobacteria bacterium]|nr:hypothetical protein [Pseudomonadota bacterium]
MPDQINRSDCPERDKSAQVSSTSEPPAGAKERQKAPCNDPLIAQLTALVDAYAASRKAKEQQRKQHEIPADVPRFTTEYPWAN